MNFNKQNIHARDEKISFEPIEHVYTVNGKQYQSVTTFIAEFFPQFDAQYWSAVKARKLGCTQEKLLAEWKRKGEAASQQGVRLHHNIESYLLGNEWEEEGAFPLFLKFHRDYSTIAPYRTEWTIYDEEHRIAGTIDLLEQHDGCFNMYDWKCSTKLIRNGEVQKNNFYGEKALSPIEHLDNTSYWHYALQQSLYRYILERYYDIRIENCHLVVLHPDYSDYYLIRLPYLQTEVYSMLNKRAAELLQTEIVGYGER